MKPIIGIVPSVEGEAREYVLNMVDVEAIKAMGGIPILLSYVEKEEEITQLVQIIDGLYLVGGNDIDPSYFNEDPHPELGEVNPTRDAFEMLILRGFLTRNKPVLGVCKGSQMINVVLGGNLYQDIYSQVRNPLIQHHQKSPTTHASHTIDLVEGTKLCNIVGQSRIKVNSRHHQAIRNVGTDIIVSSRSNDGIIESIESTKHDFVIGVQWHPENLLVAKDHSSKRIYQSFIEACKDRKKGGR